jgi:hypothetical protein
MRQHALGRGLCHQEAAIGRDQQGIARLLTIDIDNRSGRALTR